MKNQNYLIAVLIIVILFFGYQMMDLKQELKSATNSQPQITVPNGFTLYGQNNSGTNNDGFWLFMDNEKAVYFFKFDPKTNAITKIRANLYDQ